MSSVWRGDKAGRQLLLCTQGPGELVHQPHGHSEPAKHVFASPCAEDRTEARGVVTCSRPRAVNQQSHSLKADGIHSTLQPAAGPLLTHSTAIYFFLFPS